MSNPLLHDMLLQAPAGVSITDQAEDLSVIHRRDCAAAIWNRSTPPGCEAWLNALHPQQLPRARLILRPDTVERCITHLFDGAEIPPCQERNQLTADIAGLAELFSQIMKVNYLRLRLDVVQTNACRKFHVDAVRARLVCTYRGTGTQLGLSDQNDEPQCLLTLPTGIPIVLRGTKWPEFPRSGLLHRSPPIEGTGETRFVIVIDPVLAPEIEI